LKATYTKDVTDPDNRSSAENPVGQFMVAVGAVMELADTGNILLLQRNKNLDWHPGEWEIGYGRIDQFESPEQGLRRETKEELGIEDFEILELLRVWHIFRGSKKAENEVVGITYRCRTNQETIHLSDEHQDYVWVKPEKALELVAVDGIRKDISNYLMKIGTTHI
jgi:8-oxo-dGTP pyrophosphatase MutT (NUDIX family)